MPRSRVDWFWVTDGSQIDYDIPFGSFLPDNKYGVEFCLNVFKSNSSFFNDGACGESPTGIDFFYPFICQQSAVYQNCPKLDL